MLIGGGAAIAAAFRRGHAKALPKQVALGVSILTLGLAVVMAFGYNLDGGFQFTEDVTWIKAFGAHYAVGVDGLGLLMVLLTGVLVPVVIGASWYDADEGRTKAFFAWVLALEAAALAVFAATDVFFFYVVFEATLIPAYFLIGGFGGAGRRRAAVKFLIYQLAGGLVMLVSVIGLYVVSSSRGTPSYLANAVSSGHLHIDPTTAVEVAVRGLLRRLRGQGADVPGAHVAGRHHRAGDHRHERAAGLRARQDRHLRDAALLPRPVPGGLALLHAGRAGAGGDQHRSTERCWRSARATSRG